MHARTKPCQALQAKCYEDDKDFLQVTIRFSASKWNCCIAFRRVAYGPRTYAFADMKLVDINVLRCFIISGHRLGSQSTK
jgi:hypothetical protein